MSKIYVLSERSDRDVELTIYNLSESQLKILAYGIARGWNFDETLRMAERLQSVETIVEALYEKAKTQNS